MLRRIIVIVGMPRSGTSWLGQIVDSSPEVRFRLSPLFSYAFKNAVDEHSSRDEYLRVFQGAYESDDLFMSQAERRRVGQYPVFEHKNDEPEFLAIKITRFHNLIARMLDLFDDLRMVGIVRHPCGAIHSWLTTAREFPPDADPMKEWRTGACRKTGPEEFWGFEDWKKVTALHMRLEEALPDRFRIVRYEDLVDHAARETRKLFDFLGLLYGEQTDRFLKASQRRHDEDSHAVFKDPSVKLRWRRELDRGIQREIIGEIEETNLRRFIA